MPATVPHAAPRRVRAVFVVCAVCCVPSRTGPLTLRMIDLLVSSMNSTLTCVTPPRLPVLPNTFDTRAWRTSDFSSTPTAPSFTTSVFLGCGTQNSAGERRMSTTAVGSVGVVALVRHATSGGGNSMTSATATPQQHHSVGAAVSEREEDRRTGAGRDNANKSTETIDATESDAATSRRRLQVA